MKTCPKCRVPKAVGEFHLRRASADGRSPHCKKCVKKYCARWFRLNWERVNTRNKRYLKNHPEAARKASEKYRKNNQEVVRKASEKYRKKIGPLGCFANRIKSLYGLTLSEFQALSDKQGGRCAMCSEPRKLCIDHDHSTGKVRALLCFSCNKAIGFLKDSSAIAKRAVHYLQSYDR